jgi:hypothetical protein
MDPKSQLDCPGRVVLRLLAQVGILTVRVNSQQYIYTVTPKAEKNAYKAE